MPAAEPAERLQWTAVRAETRARAVWVERAVAEWPEQMRVRWQTAVPVAVGAAPVAARIQAPAV
jgi:hypothetical protein